MKSNRFVVFVFLMLSTISAWCQNRFEKDGICLYYDFIGDNEVEVSKTPWDEEYSGDIIIPEYINGYKVTRIADEAFNYCEKLTSIQIPGTIKSIGEKAFFYCKKLTSIYIPSSVEHIGEDAFCYCEFTSIEVDKDNKYYDSRENCNAIIETNSNKMIIGSKNSFIPYGIREIGENCFGYCHLKNITIPSSVEVIGACAFYVNDLTDISIPNSVKVIKSMAFSCNRIKELYIPASVVELGESPLPERVQTGIAIANPIESIVVDVDNKIYNSKGNCNAIIETAANTLIEGCKNTVIPHFVTCIGTYMAFVPYELDAEPWDIIIPANVKKVRNGAICKQTITADGRYDTKYGMKSICLYPQNPPQVFDENMQVCDGMPYTPYLVIFAKPNIFVPKDALSAYAKTKWMDNCNYIKIIENNNSRVFIDGKVLFEECIEGEEAHEEILYQRSFSNTNWQALYVPFAMTYDDWKNDFEIAKINDVNMYDTNDDGEIDDTEIEIIKVKRSTLKPNHPYLIKAKKTGDKVLVVSNSTVYTTVENYLDVSSAEMKYTFTGTYKGVSGNDMKNKHYYALSSGSLCQTELTSTDLKPFRWYMKVESRDPQVILPNTNNSRIRIKVLGEDEATDIEDIEIASDNLTVYSLDGRVASTNGTEGLSKGIYIANGKKIIVK